MTKSQNNNPKPTGQSRTDALNKQLPPSSTSTPMPKVKPPEQKQGNLVKLTKNYGGNFTR